MREVKLWHSQARFSLLARHWLAGLILLEKILEALFGLGLAALLPLEVLAEKVVGLALLPQVLQGLLRGLDFGLKYCVFCSFFARLLLVLDFYVLVLDLYWLVVAGGLLVAALRLDLLEQDLNLVFL